MYGGHTQRAEWQKARKFLSKSWVELWKDMRASEDRTDSGYEG